MRGTHAPLSTRGSTLVEGLLAILIFSVGIIGLLLFLSGAMRETGNARYRSEASLLASDLVARMWSGNRSQAALQTRFAAPDGPEYRQWLVRVQEALPGASGTNAPTVVINPDRSVTISLGWSVPGDASAHQLQVHTRITD